MLIVDFPSLALCYDDSDDSGLQQEKVATVFLYKRGTHFGGTCFGGTRLAYWKRWLHAFGIPEGYQFPLHSYPSSNRLLPSDVFPFIKPLTRRAFFQEYNEPSIIWHKIPRTSFKLHMTEARGSLFSVMTLCFVLCNLVMPNRIGYIHWEATKKEQILSA